MNSRLDLTKLSIRDRLHGNKPAKRLTEKGYSFLKEYDHLKKSLDLLVKFGLSAKEIEKMWKSQSPDVPVPKFNC